jgi:DNA-binding response OmpR family regulator
MLNLSILLITNDTALYGVISDSLCKKGLSIKKCKEEADFIKKIQRIQPDIIITDSDTKNIQAEAICKQIKSVSLIFYKLL